MIIALPLLYYNMIWYMYIDNHNSYIFIYNWNCSISICMMMMIRTGHWALRLHSCYCYSSIYNIYRLL